LTGLQDFQERQERNPEVDIINEINRIAGGCGHPGGEGSRTGEQPSVAPEGEKPETARIN